MTKLFLLLVFCHVSSPVKHSLRLTFTLSSGLPNLPEAVGAGMIDDTEAGYCDTSTKKIDLKLDWLKKYFLDKPEHLQFFTRECFENLPIFKAKIDTIKQLFSQSGGVHILQRISGCEWDENTGEVVGFLKYGYDGEDFITLDLETLEWIALKPEAVTIKTIWDTDKGRIIVNVALLTQTCPEGLKKSLEYGSSSLLRTERPSVSLLQKSPSSPVSCHATGFYPGRADLFWIKDGEEIHEDVERGEILPNHDGTFQMNVDLQLSSEDWEGYKCVFQLSGVEDIVTELDKAAIRTNFVPPSESPAGLVIGAVVGLIILGICITGFFIWKRNNNGFRPANTDSSPSSMKDAASS